MCGLVGFLNRNTDIDPLQLKRAASALRHRGPDREGIWFDATAGIGLGHCRLSILELSSAGDQPMVSHSGQYVLVYNGEVYNHLTPRENLKAEGAEPEWMGHSDTETLLAAISAWDSVGEKPLYYGMAGSSFVFASELRAIRQICGVAGSRIRLIRSVGVGVKLFRLSDEPCGASIDMLPSRLLWDK